VIAMSKLRLELESLSVESFETDAAEGPRGTVHGREGLLDAVVADCTNFNSCFCHTAYAVCGTGRVTIYSCQPTSPLIC
jgi:hypothetical protein